MGISDKDLERYLKRIAKTRHALSKPTVDREIWQQNYKALISGLESGWGTPFAEINYNSPNWKYIAELKYHTASFAAFKNHDETGKITELLIGKDGKPRKWIDFRNKAMKVSQKYNKRWLQTEYNHAHQSARMASKWKGYEADADLYQNLEYVAVMDERTRQSHAALNGAIYPINHPFWDTFYPPNGWGCRCHVRQSDAKVVEKPGIDLPKNFQNNAGKTGKVFDTKGGYYKGVGAKDRKEIDMLSNNFLGTHSKTEVQKWYAGLKVKTILEHAGLPRPVRLSGRNVETITYKGHDNRLVRNELLYDIETALKESKPAKGNPYPERKGRDKYINWYYFEVETPFKEKFWLNFVEMENKQVKLHAITSKIKTD